MHESTGAAQCPGSRGRQIYRMQLLAVVGADMVASAQRGSCGCVQAPAYSATKWGLRGWSKALFAARAPPCLTHGPSCCVGPHQDCLHAACRHTTSCRTAGIGCCKHVAQPEGCLMWRAQALKSENIKVLCVNPAQTSTPMTWNRPDADYIPEKMLQAGFTHLFPAASCLHVSRAGDQSWHLCRALHACGQVAVWEKQGR